MKLVTEHTEECKRRSEDVIHLIFREREKCKCNCHQQMGFVCPECKGPLWGKCECCGMFFCLGQCKYVFDEEDIQAYLDRENKN